MYASASYGSIIPGSGQVVAIGAGSLASTALNSHNGTARVTSTVDCFIEFGGSGQTPVAVANTGAFMTANSTEYFEVTKGGKIAVIQSVGAGSLYISLL